MEDALDGIPDKEFQKTIDNWISGNGAGLVERYNEMSLFQQSVMQVVKKSMKRVTYKVNKKTK